MLHACMTRARACEPVGVCARVRVHFCVRACVRPQGPGVSGPACSGRHAVVRLPAHLHLPGGGGVCGVQRCACTHNWGA